MAVIYRHLKSCGEVFYIGIGKYKSRAYQKKGRNVDWNEITDTCNYEVQVLKKGLTWEDACELEIALIAHYGRRDLGKGNLVNKTDGGTGFLKLKRDVHKFIDSRTGEEVTIEKIAEESGVLIGNVYKMMRGDISNFTYYVLKKDYIGIVHNPRMKKLEGNEVINTQTKEVFISMTLAAKSIGMSQTMFCRKMTGERKNNTYFVLLKDYRGIVNTPEKVRDMLKKVINTKTKEVFNSISEAAESINMPMKRLSAKLNKTDKRPNTTDFILLSEYNELLKK